ncbi:MAG: restriction endonuclease subunit R [Deltaproteobacteria bacterium]|nr:restriction endonuclease subunit R [Deltaproteobacteria bacterium]|tara:strand:+ start:13936 stop:16926 length:2991 start_codon:yes stop_codon:yes gene_type:complete
MTKPHTEKAFEDAVEEHLVEHGGYQRGSSDNYDRERALLSDDVIAFVEETQPDLWAKFEGYYKDNLRESFLKALDSALRSQGSLNVIRHGFKFSAKLVRLAYFAPAHGLNPEQEEKYSANRLTVVRQLHFDPESEKSLDLVLFLNGIPVVTAELKNHMTGQTVNHAKHQYREDRDPKAPIFRFKERTLVHFAVDPDEVFMTTRLAKKKTFFLPFNQGHGTAKGNPPNPNGHRTAYLWERVWQRDNLLDLVGRFIHLQVEKIETSTGKEIKKETMIFPRFHQWDAVRKLLRAAKANGAGTNYLVQHSAGSGKSNTIAWLAHRLSSLHDVENQRVYNSIIVITDRTVLDRQLQDTIYQFDHVQGVVQVIDKDSNQLADAIAKGVPIIITTLQKFPFITNKVGELPDRRYAIIVDEAHSSQSGEMSLKVKEILSDSTVDGKLEEEADDLSAPDQLALRAALFRGPQPNMSFFAFTATPKYKTLEMFGHKDSNGKPAPFHLYSMRQAIEEGFILDVLKNYTTYKTYYRLAKEIEDDPKLDKKKAARALARFASLHPHNIAQKTEVMIEHFRQFIRHKIGGRAKAMVVTGSRLHAVKYKLEFDRYIKEKGYGDNIKCLVAFSGTVEDDVNPEVKYTEVEMNEGIKEKELPGKFDVDEFKILLVANKYQTGFDQPLLHTMYVDKRLSGIQAVQTLSRLNRTHKGKEDTFILDFRNEREEILASFQPFYEQTTIAELVDPQRLYELQSNLNATQIYHMVEVDNFGKVFFNPKSKQAAAENKQLNAYLDPAVDRFKGREEEEQEMFRSLSTAFVRLYAFLGQLIPFADYDLEKLYAFLRMLSSKLPKRGERTSPVNISDDVSLEYYRLDKIAEGQLELIAGEVSPIYGPSEVGTGKGEEEKVELSKLLDVLNDRFGTDFSEADQLFIDQIKLEAMDNEELKQAARVNKEDGFGLVFKEVFVKYMLDRYEANGQFVDHVLTDDEFRKMLEKLLTKEMYETLRVEG